MKKTLKITVLQTNIIWNERKSNLYFFDKIINDYNNTDLLILPEMFDTGFVVDENLIEKFDFDYTLQWMKNKAVENNFAICGSTIIKDENVFKNRFYFVKPDKSFDYYDKRHLFSMSGEDKVLKRGSERKLIDFQGWKIFPQICYDLRFPVWARNDFDYDLLIYVANWPSGRIEQWKALLIARAIENQSYVVGVNRIGTDGNAYDYSGNSLVVDFKGNILYEAKQNEQDVFSIEIDLVKLHEARKKFPVLKDRDRFRIG